MDRENSHVTMVISELQCTPAQLAIAWCLRNPDVPSVIIDASTPEKARENIQALKIRHLLTEDVILEMDRARNAPH